MKYHTNKTLNSKDIRIKKLDYERNRFFISSHILEKGKRKWFLMIFGNEKLDNKSKFFNLFLCFYSRIYLFYNKTKKFVASCKKTLVSVLHSTQYTNTCFCFSYKSLSISSKSPSISSKSPSISSKSLSISFKVQVLVYCVLCTVH